MCRDNTGVPELRVLYYFSLRGGRRFLSAQTKSRPNNMKSVRSETLGLNPEEALEGSGGLASAFTLARMNKRNQDLS